MKLKKNVGTVDKIVRYVIAIVALIVAMRTTGWVAGVAYVVTAVAALTATLGYCHLYTLLGIHTTK